MLLNASTGIKAVNSKKKNVKNAEAHALRQRQRRCRAGKAFARLRELLPGIEPRANQARVVDYLAAYLRFFNSIVYPTDIDIYHSYFAEDVISGKIDPAPILGISHEMFIKNLFPQIKFPDKTDATHSGEVSIHDQSSSDINNNLFADTNVNFVRLYNYFSSDKNFTSAEKNMFPKDR
ncbi:uncharacterized protein LOC129588371 isoform X2 [Paramacrobiotus metropolitanus]|uniref:uncharacterized protein LOC129588371 isoform X2 n=1 Tax=Paramacrobiotus metropolitanus TaxID=2943436 RepID=UPI002445F4D0|nr:uncharacterized protein LOC129588371 isoform X2 [Paramacrobiotus metropolitanus]